MSVGLTSVHLAPEPQSDGAHTQWAGAAPLEVQREGSAAQRKPAAKAQVPRASGFRPELNEPLDELPG
jgi:hypothetical protein